MAHESVVTVVNTPLKTNKVYQQMLTNERSNFTDQGNNTYLDKSNVTRDAIGREIEVGSGYDLHSDITPADKSNNNIQADSTLNDNSQNAIMNDSLLEYDNEIQNFTDSGNVIPYSDSVISIDKTATIGLVTVPNLEGIESGIATDVAIKSMDDISAQLQADLAVQVEEENLYATATDVAQTSLSDKAKIDSERLITKEKAEEAEIKTENEIKLFETKLEQELKNDALRAKNTEEKAAADLAEAQKLAFIDSQSLNNGSNLNDQLAGQMDLESNGSVLTNDNVAILNSQTEGFNDIVLGVTKEDMEDTIAELEKERIRKEAEAEAHERAQSLLNDEQSTNSKNIATKSAEQHEKDVAERIQELSAKKREQAVQDRIDAIKQKEQINSETPDTAEQNALDTRLQREKHLEQINNADANDIAPKGSIQIAKEKAAASRVAEFMRVQAEARDGLGSQETADRVGDHNSRNSVDPQRFGINELINANDPYAFSTLAYPSDVTHTNESGHYVLFYVNVQNKTKYKYDGIKNGKRVTVGDSYVKDMDVIPGNLVVSEEARKSSGTTKYFESGAKEHFGLDDIDYQSQIIKNGGVGTVLYNNLHVLQKSRKSPLTGINSKFPTTTRITDSDALYLPPSIGNTQTASYGDSATGVAGYLALSGVDLVKAVKDHDFAGAADTLFDAAGMLATEAVKKFAVGAVEGFTGSEGVQQTFDKAFGQTLNPFIEVTYNSVGMRQFDYTFKFAPTSAKETAEVQAIIKLFRFHMLPEMKGDIHRYLTLPSTFDIHYMFQSSVTDTDAARENSFFNKIATCVCTNVDVNYTPDDGIQSFSDGAPTQINMTLGFKETEMMTKHKVNDGF